FSLDINSLKNNDLGDYVCLAVNNVGKARAIITVTDEPSAPEFTSNINGDQDTSYVLTWDAQSYYNITKYTMKCREWDQDATEPTSPETWKDMANYTASSADMDTKDDLTSFKVTLSPLKPATDYECHVQIYNGHKWGPGNNYMFSTRKHELSLLSVSPAEKAPQTTGDGNRISSFCLNTVISTAISLLLILNV
ncbi:unnamed protein product, partial [Meganyctiphanes norvegica]